VVACREAHELAGPRNRWKENHFRLLPCKNIDIVIIISELNQRTIYFFKYKVKVRIYLFLVQCLRGSFREETPGAEEGYDDVGNIEQEGPVDLVLACLKDYNRIVNNNVETI
jgi:hypothetical protein